MSIKGIFLGTGTSQGVPVIGCKCEVCKSVDFRDKRLRTSFFLEYNGKGIVIDTGPDFRQQMLRERITKVDAILFTHEHKDHTGGLDDIRPFNFAHQMDIPVYASKRVFQSLEREYAYIFEARNYPGVPKIIETEIENKPFDLFNETIIPVEVMHFKLPVLGFKVKGLTYITDAKTVSDAEIEKIKGTEVLIVNGLQKIGHYSHFTIDEALAFIQKVNPGKAYITHISHLLGLHAKAEKELPENVFLGYDGLKIEI